MSKKEQQFLDSRIFGSKSTSSTEQSQAKVFSVPRSEAETFNISSFASEKPSGSVYDASSNDQALTQSTADVGSWVTVIGSIPGRLTPILDYFSKFGTILKAEDTPGNWIYLEFPSKEIANIVLTSCANSPQLIDNTMAVAVAPGRIRSSYVPGKPEIPTKVEFKPTHDNVVFPREDKHITGKIFDAVFG